MAPIALPKASSAGGFAPLIVSSVAVAGAFLLGAWLARPARHTDVFVLAIVLKVAPGRAAEWLARWAELAAHCAAHEPETLTYVACVSDKDPDTILIHERYVAKSSLTEVHQKSAPFAAFGEWARATNIVVSKEGASYIERAGYTYNPHAVGI